MAVEQMNISISPQMAKFIRSKVKAGGYTNISEVVRTAVRRMQEEEFREARLARLAADEILDELRDADKASIRQRSEAGFAAIERGEYTDYVGREGLGNLAAEVKSRGRKLLAGRAPKA
jgi:putative addiction module CopG family antidote